MHTFAWLKQQYHDLNNTHQLSLFWEVKTQHVDKTRKSSKTNLIYEGSSCNLCNHTHGLTMSRWDKTEVTNSKKTVMSFHNYEKKVNRKTNKIRQVLDDPKKNIKCSGKKRSKKKQSIRKTKEKEK